MLHRASKVNMVMHALFLFVWLILASKCVLNVVYLGGGIVEIGNGTSLREVSNSPQLVFITAVQANPAQSVTLHHWPSTKDLVFVLCLSLCPCGHGADFNLCSGSPQGSTYVAPSVFENIKEPKSRSLSNFPGSLWTPVRTCCPCLSLQVLTEIPLVSWVIIE